LRQQLLCGAFHQVKQNLHIIQRQMAQSDAAAIALLNQRVGDALLASGRANVGVTEHTSSSVGCDFTYSATFFAIVTPWSMIAAYCFWPSHYELMRYQAAYLNSEFDEEHGVPNLVSKSLQTTRFTYSATFFAIVTPWSMIAAYCFWPSASRPIHSFSASKRRVVCSDLDTRFGTPCSSSNSELYRDYLDGLELVDSVTLDFHKQFFQTISCGAFLLKVCSDLDTRFGTPCSSSNSEFR
jgi:hypothetical protein